MEIEYLAVIDHWNNKLTILVADAQEIAEIYKGEEESYIREKCGFAETDMFSWDYLTSKIEIVGDIRCLHQMIIHNSHFVDLVWHNS